MGESAVTFQPKSLYGLLCLVLVGCAPKYTPFASTTAEILSYQVGQIHEASVGEAFVRGMWGEAYEAFEVSQSTKPPPIGVIGGQEQPTWPRGKLLPIVGAAQTSGGAPAGYYLLDPESGFWVSVLEDGRIFKGWTNPSTGSVSQKAWPEDIFLRRSAEPYFMEDGAFKAELVYSGRDGDAIAVMYREYSGDFARPAFSQDLRYDLSESDVIRFRGLEVEVIEATNSTIRFRVLSDDNGQWVGL